MTRPKRITFRNLRLSERGLTAGSLVKTFLLAALTTVLPALANVRITELHYHPQSERLAEEFLELHNAGAVPVNLGGWRFNRGINFTFPEVTLPPGGFLIVAADTNVFNGLHPNPGVPVLGNWTGALSDHGEELRLVTAAGSVVEEFAFATQGDWGERHVGPLHLGFRGLIWNASHDGLGRTLERINPLADGGVGQNWQASAVAGGSPGGTNSVHSLTQAPFITEVAHSPAVPRSTSVVTFNARISGGPPGVPQVRLHHRVDGAAIFAVTPMADDGAHGDGLAGDGRFGAHLPAQPAGTVVEYFVEAVGAGNLVRTWPAPLLPARTQTANALYQVDDSPEGTLPRFRIIVTEADRQTLAAIEAQVWHSTSDAQVNATVIATEGSDADIRHEVGFRIRGSTSRDILPPSRRVAFPDDRTWHGFRAVALNGIRPYSQVAAAALAQLSGLPAARVRLVEVRENGVARAGVGSPVPGLYAQHEVLNSDFTDVAFPDDGNGNLYSADGNGNLDHLGADPAAYATDFRYYKESNDGENDWTDLIEMTRVLNETPAAEYAAEVAKVADVDEWVRFFAVNILLANSESTLSNPRVTRPTPEEAVVTTGDYYLYRGVTDRRFRLIPYDFDSCLGAEGAATASQGLYQFVNVPALARLFSEPTFAARHHATLRRLADTVFALENVNPLLDRLLAPHIPAEIITGMKEFNARRRDIVLQNLPSATRVTTSFPTVAGYAHATNGTVTLAGTAAAAGVAAIRVNGTPAVWDALQGRWSADVSLLPGLNRLLIESHDALGNVLATHPFDLWREAAENVVAGPLAADTRWRAEDGPFHVTGNLLVPAGMTLTIDPGTSVYFSVGAGLQVQGRLLAEGTPHRRIQLLNHPRLGGRWRGISFDGATNENRVVEADFRSVDRQPLLPTGSVLTLERVEWPGHSTQVLRSINSSLKVRRCVFPTMSFDETVTGVGLPESGHYIFEGNVFGSTQGYADILDFSGGQRPGPIPQFLNNVFLGGSDDGLDLDGTDAHIEGNVFMHFRKNNTSTSIAGAIATGRDSQGRTSRITVVRNVFFDNDHDFILKDFSELTAAHNTFVGGVEGSIAFSEPERAGSPPLSAVLRDNIWWNYPRVMAGLDTNLFTNAWFVVRVDNSILPENGPWTGTNNFSADPLFLNPTNDFRLLTASPARGLAPGGLDLGAHVLAWTHVVGSPLGSSAQTSVTLQVLGAGLTHYRFALGDAPFGGERVLSEPIHLDSLTPGTQRVRVIGKNSAGVWQPEPGTVAEWEVVGDFAGARINELLAENAGAVPVGSQTPDLVELFNPGTLPLDLGGMSFTDNPDNPRKYVFPAGTLLDPGAHLVLYADNRSQPPGIHLGFAFDNDGEQALLFDSPARGGALLDRVDFGPQLPGLSIGRSAAGSWTLCHPTFGSPNEPHPLGDNRRVRLNEWLADPGLPGVNDWIELHNPEPLPVVLDGLFLTDAPGGAPRRSPMFPLSFMSARGFLVLEADGDENEPGHASFSLDADFGSIALTDQAGLILDGVFHGPQSPARSEGRVPDGIGLIRTILPAPTPGASNGLPPAEPLVLGWTYQTAGGLFTVNLQGTVPGVTYRLEGRESFVTGWNLLAEVTATGANVQFAPVATTGDQRFFRALTQQ